MPKLINTSHKKSARNANLRKQMRERREKRQQALAKLQTDMEDVRSQWESAKNNLLNLQAAFQSGPFDLFVYDTIVENDSEISRLNQKIYDAMN